jgi:hypothetical protein
VAEWPIAAVLKTAVQKWTVGSNPTSSESKVVLHTTPPFLFKKPLFFRIKSPKIYDRK